MIEYTGYCPACGNEYDNGDDQEILQINIGGTEILVKFECCECGEDKDYYFTPSPAQTADIK